MTRQVKLLEFHVVEDDAPSRWEAEIEVEEFTVRVLASKATVAFRHPPHTMDTALQLWNRFLGSVEGRRLVQTGPRRRRFQFGCCRYVGGGGSTFALATVRRVGVDDPKDEVPSWLAEVRDRLERYFRQGGSAQSEVWACFQAIKEHLGGETTYLQRCKVSSGIRRELGRLCGTIGTPAEARKYKDGHEHRNLTDQEKFWLEQTAVELLCRAQDAAQAGETSRPSLTLDDLPPLNRLS